MSKIMVSVKFEDDYGNTSREEFEVSALSYNLCVKRAEEQIEEKEDQLQATAVEIKTKTKK